ncbi:MULTISPECIES: ECF transporter S component [Caproicibacterium]|uniref:Riboflavin transporter n=1 Tax=Caproicibacterium lactatifermentans TaxID=2666138 RepID=A0A859DRV2_9FIRM|nr:ECF transporter S component [Caproicibacterium lactatifermentans]ARP49847.1 ECF transporter S component [Ruminococcaceae bacterium CPB6]MDD4807204.1 ECF transporter S component [Oscillospiraceae bacterium]QKN24426.1 ECF transporter S component [Caproicibacterium lactatifermentans]QKO30561.1 ECF transporter S component [Caproicibacterium lactatifermentans]
MATQTQATTLKKTAKLTSTRSIAVIGILGALSAVVMAFEFPLPFLPAFYKLDFSEVPVLLGGFALGPAAAAVIEAMKVILHMLIGGGSQTAGIGELANFIIGCSLVVPAALIYRYHKARKTAVVGMGVGTVLMAVVGGLMNAFLLLPIYAAAFHMPLNAIIGMGTKINASINNMTTFVLFATTPLNLIKAVLVSIITFALYKYVSPVLHGRRR